MKKTEELVGIWAFFGMVFVVVGAILIDPAYGLMAAGLIALLVAWRIEES